MKIRKTGLLVTILLITGLGTFGFLYRKDTNRGVSTGIGKVARTDLIQRVTIAGSIDPEKSSVIAAPYDGYVKKLHVKLGQMVKQGDPLVSISQTLSTSDPVYPIRAAFSGKVVQVLKKEGQFVKQGDAKDYILRVDDLSQLYVVANSPELDVVKIKPKLEAEIKVSPILDKTFKGVVEEISQAATAKEQWGGRSQVEYVIRIRLTDANDDIKPGMSSIVDIIAAKKEKVLTLPHEFVQRDGDKFFVEMKNGVQQPIKVGLQNETSFEITTGLKEGDEVRQTDFLKLIEQKKK